MKIILLLISMSISFSAIAQKDFDRITDEQGELIYKGHFLFEDLLTEPLFPWMKAGIEEYAPDSNALKFLKKNLPGYELVIFLGTWCSDSHTMIPSLYKTLQESAMPAKYAIYGVDMAKEEKYVAHKLYKVEYVPTVILIRNNMEIGRIVETTRDGIETDLKHLIEADLKQQQ